MPQPSRRKPTQQRSRATVERIIDAAVSVLADVGYHQASTNRIASAAGVSPGTLYGYFSDKDEIVSAVIDRVVDGFGEGVAPALRAAATRPEHEATRMVLDAVLTELDARAPLIEAFMDRVPAERYAARLELLRTRVSDIAFQLVAARAPGASPDDLERAVWMSVRIVEHLSVRYVLTDPRPFPREAFLDQLTHTAIGLTPGPTRG